MFVHYFIYAVIKPTILEQFSNSNRLSVTLNGLRVSVSDLRNPLNLLAGKGFSYFSAIGPD